MRAYRSNRRRAWFAGVLIVVISAVGAGGIVSWGLRRVSMGLLLVQSEYPAYRSVSTSHAEFVEVVTGVLASFLLLLPVAGIAFIVWLSRAAANLQSLAISGVRLQPGWAVGAVLAACPAPAAAIILPDLPYYLGRDSTPYLLALMALAEASLVLPLVVIGRLWDGSTGDPAETRGFGLGAISTPTGVVAWWAAFVLTWTAYGLGDFVGQLPDEDVHPFVDTSTRMLAEGVLTLIAAIALVASAALIIRNMFRINAMQDALARTLPQPRSRRERGAVTPTRRAATQWQCESCDVMSPTAVRFCQNCASERR